METKVTAVYVRHIRVKVAAKVMAAYVRHVRVKVTAKVTAVSGCCVRELRLRATSE